MAENKENDINYHYVNTNLELVKGIPASTLFAWLPSLLFMNIASIVFSIVASIIIIGLYRGGFNIIESLSIIKFILRSQKPRLFNNEDKYEKDN